MFIPRLWLGPPSDQQVLETPLVGDECITKTTPTGHIYTTEPHGGVLFSALKKSTGEVAAPPAIDMPETDRGVMMPTRKQTRERDRRDRIAQERRERTELIAEKNASARPGSRPTTNRRHSEAPATLAPAVSGAGCSARWRRSGHAQWWCRYLRQCAGRRQFDSVVTQGNQLPVCGSENSQVPPRGSRRVGEAATSTVLRSTNRR